MTVKHQPYVSPYDSIPEFTPKAVILGVIFGMLFGATTVYLALKIGLTVSASIPIAVLAIAIFKKFSHSTILENNIVQTTGSAGESIAAGVAFTLPALVFLSEGSDYFKYFQIFVLALVGGILGVLFMIPLRRPLIVQEHGHLLYPEGTACADVLLAGEKGGNLAKLLYQGLFVGVLYKVLMSIVGLWKDTPQYIFSRKSALPNGILEVEITPEMLGVGYIIGIRNSGLLVAGGVLSALVLTPLITFFGDNISTVVLPGKKLISEMTPREIWSQYIRFIGAGAVTFGGIVTMLKALPMIVQTFVKGIAHLKSKGTVKAVEIAERTDRDLPFWVVGVGIVGLLAIMLIMPNIPVNFFSAILVVIAGFFFVTVSSRITGIIGSSSNPISGMAIATLMGTSLLFISQGWTGEIYQPIALCIGGMVTIAASNAGTTSQDLKTGFLVGATPYKQQIGIIIGTLASVIVVGFTITLLHNTLGFGEVTPEHQHPLPAPQATLMATIIKGLFDQSLPWTLIFIGMGIAAVVELCGIGSLAFAVGAYLPLATTSPIFIGGLVKWLVRRKKKIRAEDAELESGALFSSGLIAGGALTGILIAALLGTNMGFTPDGKSITLMDYVNTHLDERMVGASGDIIALGCFIVLALMLFVTGIKKDENNQTA